MHAVHREAENLLVPKNCKPDHWKYSGKLRRPRIGEEGDTHISKFLLVNNVDTRKLSWVLSTPAGAESTGLRAVDEINGRGLVS